MSYKNRSLVRMDISEEAKKKLPESRKERSDFIRTAVERYTKTPKKKASRLDRYHLTTVSFDDEGGTIRRMLAECNGQIAPCNILNDAILHA